MIRTVKISTVNLPFWISLEEEVLSGTCECPIIVTVAQVKHLLQHLIPVKPPVSRHAWEPLG